MSRAQGDDQCQHSGCKWPRPAAWGYCSDHCADAQRGGVDEVCGCGQPECG